MSRSDRIVTVVTSSWPSPWSLLARTSCHGRRPTVVEDAADATIECTGWTGATDDCGAWGAEVLAEGAPSNTFDFDDVERIRLDRPTFGLADECTVEYFVSRYPDEAAWSEEIDCPE